MSPIGSTRKLSKLFCLWGDCKTPNPCFQELKGGGSHSSLVIHCTYVPTITLLLLALPSIFGTKRYVACFKCFPMICSTNHFLFPDQAYSHSGQCSSQLSSVAHLQAVQVAPGHQIPEQTAGHHGRDLQEAEGTRLSVEDHHTLLHQMQVRIVRAFAFRTRWCGVCQWDLSKVVTPTKALIRTCT